MTVAMLLLGVACQSSEESGDGASQLPASTSTDLIPIPDAPAISIVKEDVVGAEARLEVVAARPTGQVGGAIRPTLTFSKPIVALATIESRKPMEAPASLSPAIEGQWKWIGSASVEFVPKGLIPYATAFKVTVKKGLEALDGSVLEKAYTWEFSTPKPNVQSVTPYSNPKRPFRWFGPDQAISLFFNQPVKNIEQHLRFELEGEQVAPAVTVVKEVNVAEERQAEQAEQGVGFVSRMSAEQTGYKDRRTRYEIKAATPLPLDTSFELVITAGLEGAEGSLKLEKEKRYKFRTYGDMEITKARGCLFPRWEKSHCSYGPLILFTSNVAKVEGLKERLTVTPPVEIDWDRVNADMPWDLETQPGPYIAVSGRFMPGKTYKVKVAEGLEDENGQTAGAFAGSFTLDDISPYFQVDNQRVLIEAEGDGTLPIESANISRVNARVWTLKPSEMAVALSNYQYKPRTRPTVVQVDVSGTRNRTRWSPLELRQAFEEGHETGLFLTTMRSPDLGKRSPKPRVIGQVTDLAVHAKVGATSSLAWVTRLSSGEPVPDAVMEMYDKKGKLVWEGVSDNAGLVEIPGLAGLFTTKYSWQTPFALIAARDGDDIGVTASNWQGPFWPGSFGLSSDWEGKSPQSLGLVFADRGIYRPGDTVYIKGLARYRRMGVLESPAKGTRIQVKVTDSKGEEVFSNTLLATKYGTFSANFALPKEVPLGQYSVRATGSQEGGELTYYGSFRVEEYRAPQFLVDVESPRDWAVAGEPLEASVLSRYLFGGAMADAPARWSVARRSTFFVPPGHDDYIFGAHTWWWDDEEPEMSGDVFAAGDGKTDVQGRYSIKAGVAEAPGDKTWEYTIEAEVEDVNRQRTADRSTILVHPAAYYAGIRVQGSGFAKAGKEVKLGLLAVDPDGVAKVGVALSLEVKRRTWKNIRKKGVGGQWFTVSEPEETSISKCDAKSELEAASCTFTPDKPGLYLLEATVLDEQGRKQVTRSSIYAVGDGWVSWQRRDTDQIELVVDKDLYEVGDTARILVKSPYPEAEALVTVEREGVLSKRLVHLSGSANTIEVPLEESMVPNVFVGVVIARGRVPATDGLETGDDPGRPSVRVGYAQLKVQKRSKILSVKVTPDQEDKRPRDKVRVALEVKDWQGKGTPSELTVWAVDEGVLRLTGYETPNAVDAIYRHRGLSVRIGEPVLHLVMRRLYGQKGETVGGSGGMDPTGSRIRSNFKTTVIFAPEVHADAQGRATVEFELPDNLTTFRIMAMAVDESDRFGSGESKVVVSKPLMAMAALPRLARVGDKFEAGVVVHTKGAGIDQVSVKADVTGLALTGPPTQSISMKDGKAREVRFDFTAEQEGQATLRFTVAGGGEEDALERKLPIKLPVSTEAVAAYGDTTDKRTEGLLPPEGVRKDVGGLELTLASTILGGFDEGMRQLIDYPYGCLEQLSSRLVPFVALRELYGTFGEEMPTRPTAADDEEERLAFIRDWLGEETLVLYKTTDPDQVVRQTVTAIERLQNHDGGYKYWSSSSCSADYASSYAVLALGQARDAGYTVNPASLQRGQNYLANVVAAGKSTNCAWYKTKPSDTTRVFALYALAQTHQAKPSYYGALYRKRSDLPLFAKAMLAHTMFTGGGDRKQARALFSEVMNFAQESSGEVHFEEKDPETYATMWSSDTRTTAIVLQTLTALSPDHPYVAKIGRYLTTIRKGNGRFRNTQEAAYSLMALSDVVRNKEKAEPDFVAKVLLGEESLLESPFRGRSMSVQKHKVPIEKLAAKVGGDLGKSSGLLGKLSGNGSVPLVFSKEGLGTLYYGALLRYAPLELPTKALDRGIVVQRWFEPFDGGGQARAFKAGELVRIRVRVGTPGARNYVVVDVPLPSGLEPVDTSLATTARLSRSNENEGYEDEYGYENDFSNQSPWASAFYSPFNHVEQRDDRVFLFADELPPGVHVSSFVARATTPGDFVLKPARAEEMYAPETFGRSDGGRMRIFAAEQTASR